MKFRRSAATKSSFTAQAGPARWVWPLTAVIITVVLAAFGRYLVAGLFAVVGVAFLLALVSALVWTFVAMARPGPRGALHEVPGSWREGRESVTGVVRRLIHRLGQASWRSPQRVVHLVAHQLGEKAFNLPTGPVAYSHIRVRMNPTTLQLLDQWMPIEQVASTWAHHYGDTHHATRGMDESVTVTVDGSEGLPRGRAVVEGSFRGWADSPDTWARATHSRVAGDEQSSGRGNVRRLVAEDTVAHQPSTAAPTADEHATVLDPAATVRLPVAEAGRDVKNPDTGPGAGLTTTQPQARVTSLDQSDTSGQATQRIAEATVRIPTVEPRRVGGGETARIVAKTSLGQAGPLVLQRLDPATARPLASSSEHFDMPRIRVGRDAGMDLTIDDPFTSREHAELRRVGDRWSLADSFSTHGTTLNGIRVTAGEQRVVGNGDTITFGRNAGAATYRVVLTMAQPGTKLS